MCRAYGICYYTRELDWNRRHLWRAIAGHQRGANFFRFCKMQLGSFDCKCIVFPMAFVSMRFLHFPNSYEIGKWALWVLKMMCVWDWGVVKRWQPMTFTYSRFAMLQSIGIANTKQRRCGFAFKNAKIRRPTGLRQALRAKRGVGGLGGTLVNGEHPKIHIQTHYIMLRSFAGDHCHASCWT